MKTRFDELAELKKLYKRSLYSISGTILRANDDNAPPFGGYFTVDPENAEIDYGQIIDCCGTCRLKGIFGEKSISLTMIVDAKIDGGNPPYELLLKKEETWIGELKKLNEVIGKVKCTISLLEESYLSRCVVNHPY